MSSEPTMLEAIASQREAREQAWRAADRDERRRLILRVLAEQHRRALSSNNENPNPRRAYVSEELLAADVAQRIGIEGTRRLGNGAVAGSWSGTRSSALRVVPALRSLTKDSLVRSRPQAFVRTRTLYAITDAGRRHLEETP